MKKLFYSILFSLLIVFSIGCSKSDDSPTAPETPAPNAAFTFTGTQIAPATLTFTNTSTDADSFEWNFGNGNVSTQTNPTNLFSAFGVFTVRLIAFQTSTGRSDTAQQQITIAQVAPNAAFSFSGTTVTPANISFSNTSTNADQYHWDFGDGRTSIQTSPSMAFNTYGQFIVTLVAIQSSTSRSDTARQTISITPGIVYLDSVDVNQIPFTDPQGVGWDLSSGPDLYFDLTIGTSIITTSSYYADLTPTQLPVGWFYDGGHRINNWSTTYGIDLWDYDGGTDDDYIGSVFFSINGVSSTNYYPRTVNLTNSAQTIRVTIALRWQ